MLIAVFALQIILAIAIAALFLRKPPAAPSDPAIARMLDQLTRLDARADHVRDSLAQIRSDMADESQRNRAELAKNLSDIGRELKGELNNFREDNRGSDGEMRKSVQDQIEFVAQRLKTFTSDSNVQQIALREALNSKLSELMGSNAMHQDKLRSSVEGRLDKLNSDNTAKLDQMRATVEEKLDKTLHSRLTDSFGQVTTHLGEVQKGLGEMKELATGFGDIRKVLSNVSRRGSVGEFLVGQQIEQMFSREQYLKQANIKPTTAEKVDFALKIPSGEPGSFVLLPIDAKFPTSDWERLEHARDQGTTEEIASTGKAFERSIRAQAKSICDKYIDPPTTMPHAIMVLPTENLYAEVVSRPGLLSDIQSACRVTVAGPSTFMAILTSFQMGFHTLAIQRKGDEVWNVLSKTKTEFGTFGGLMDKVEKQVGTVQNTLGDIKKKTAKINASLRDVSNLNEVTSASSDLSLDDLTAFVPMLAATEADE